MTKNLNKIWAKSMSLSAYFGVKLDQVEIDKTPLPPVPDIEGENGSNFARTLHYAASSMASSIESSQKRRAATEQLRNELISGDLVLIGIRQSEENAPSIEMVDPEYWVAAQIDPESGEAQADIRRYRDLRVPLSPAHNGLQTETPVTVEKRKIVPAPKILRAKAIAGLYSQKTVDFDDTNLRQRTVFYKRWISEHYPGCDLDQRGFSEESFEADETKYKKKHGLIRS